MRSEPRKSTIKGQGTPIAILTKGQECVTVEQLLRLSNMEGMNSEFIPPQRSVLQRINAVALRLLQTHPTPSKASKARFIFATLTFTQSVAANL